MNSIYKGTISHSRKKEALHSFTYSTSMLLLDLDYIKNAFSQNFFWSYEKCNLASFYRKDFFGDSKKSLKSEISKFVAKELNVKIEGKIYLLTTLRYFGCCFNPVSFYYCYNKKKELVAIVSHITNTPWEERHAYIHDCRKLRGGTKIFEFKNGLGSSMLLST